MILEISNTITQYPLLLILGIVTLSYIVTHLYRDIHNLFKKEVVEKRVSPTDPYIITRVIVLNQVGEVVADFEKPKSNIFGYDVDMEEEYVLVKELYGENQDHDYLVVGYFPKHSVRLIWGRS